MGHNTGQKEQLGERQCPRRVVCGVGVWQQRGAGWFQRHLGGETDRGGAELPLGSGEGGCQGPCPGDDLGRCGGHGAIHGGGQHLGTVFVVGGVWGEMMSSGSGVFNCVKTST